ncbi:peptidoglycan recognition protein [Streptomyces sp. LN785]|uniref:peptidoglycan recognition protein family protein n=1 Tax=Streptomyces sp. LN785 TaxID=3112983 RepID=UPI0037238BCC
MRLYRTALWLTAPLGAALVAAPAGVTTAGGVAGTMPGSPLSVWAAGAAPETTVVDASRPFPVLRAMTVALPHAAPRPTIVSRTQWRADETKRDPHAHYANGVTAIFIHHTDTPNNYDCADVPRTLRNLYTGQTRDRGWGDLGYNFLVDKCGTIYEGRAGGTDRAVVGSHTVGFNQGTTGIAAIGTYGPGVKVPAAMEHAIAALAAWKLGLLGIDASGKVRLTSTNNKSRYAKGTSAAFDAISGHRDAYMTNCPGEALFNRLPSIRAMAAALQGRTAQAPSVTAVPTALSSLPPTAH